MKEKKNSEPAIGTLWISGDICEETFANFLSNFYNMLASSADIIEICICSFGGSYDHGIAFYEEIRLSTKPTITRIQGIAASAASIITQAGATRVITKNSTIMMHKPASVLGEGEYSAEDLKILRAKNLSAEQKVLKIFSEKTGKTPQKIRKDIGTLKTFTAEEALAYGLVDAII
jgi:ATP-dependent Clp protease protease subunit